MKKVILILCSILMPLCITQAQDVSNYLTKAFELLLEGNLSSAEKNYIVYKKLSGKTDADFEAMLQNDKANQKDAWKNECYIIDIDNEYALAVQKSSISKNAQFFDDALRYAKSSRLGGFTDWYLPNLEEFTIVFANLPSGTIKPYNIYEFDRYWTNTARQDKIVVVKVKSTGYDGTFSCVSSYSPYNFIIVRKFKKNN